MNFETLPTILGDQVTLRPFSDEDVSTVAVLANDPSVSEGTKVTPFPYTEADAARWIDGHASNIASGAGYSFAVAKRQSGELLGAVEIRRDEDAADAYEIGYWIGAPYRGRGFATEAVRLVLGFAARYLPLGRVGAYVDVENASSRRVLAKCGMRLVQRGASRSGQDYFSLAERADRRTSDDP